MSGYTRNITKKMRTMRNDLESRFTSIYCVADFKGKLRELKFADADRRPSVRSKIAEMLSAVGINCDLNGSFNYYKNYVDLIAQEPEKYGVFVNTEQVTEKILSTILGIYNSFPPPGELLDRIISKLDNNTAGSVRLKLLKRFIKTVNVPENSRYFSKELKKQGENIDESIFDSISESNSLNPNLKAYIFVKTYGDFLVLTKEENQELSKTLSENVNKDYLNSGKSVFEFLAEFEKSQFDNLFDDNGGEEFCELATQYKKSCLARIKSEKNDVFDEKQQELKALDKLYRSRQHDARKNRPQSLNLLRCCDSLANGRFISKASVKETLFLFAFAYDMRYYFDNQDDYDVHRDVEKNLFKDYYCDNLSRFLVEDVSSKSGANLSEPSGMGLSFKNFVDAVFIYCLNADLPSNEKVSMFYTMLERIKSEYIAPNGKVRPCDETAKRFFEEKDTYNLKDEFYRNAMRKNPDEFCRYILDNYYCDTRVLGENEKEVPKGFFEIDYISHRPFDMYKELMEVLEEELYLPADLHLRNVDRRSFPDSNSESAFANFADEEGQLLSAMEVLRANVPDIPETAGGEELPKGLKTIISQMKKRLDPEMLVEVKSKEDVTRTRIVSAYYHLYCLQCDIDNMDCNAAYPSFRETYEDFQFSMDGYLEPIGFQTTDEKNLFDLLVALFAYCRINNRLGEE